MMPLLATIAKNQRAPKLALPVVVLLVEQGLLTRDFQRVKLLTIATMTGTSRQHACTVLRWLTRNHYLERRDEPFVGALYRLTEGTR